MGLLGLLGSLGFNVLDGMHSGLFKLENRGDGEDKEKKLLINDKSNSNEQIKCKNDIDKTKNVFSFYPNGLSEPNGRFQESNPEQEVTS